MRRGEAGSPIATDGQELISFGPRWGRRLLQLAASLGVLMAVLALSHPARLAPAVSRAQPLPILAVVLVNLPVVVLRSWRAGLIVRRLGHPVAQMPMLGIQLVGQTASTLTPAAGGDLIRAYLWRREVGMPLSGGVAAVTFERLTSLWLLIVVAVLALAVPHAGILSWPLVLSVIPAGSLAPWLVTRVPAQGGDRILARALRVSLLRRRAHGVQAGIGSLHDLGSSVALVASTSLLTLGILVLSGLQVLLTLAALGGTVSLAQAVAASAVSQVGGILSTLPFGLGPADALLVGLLSGFGVGITAAAAVAILQRATATLPMALAAIPAYLLLDRSARRVRQPAHHSRAPALEPD